MHILHQSYLCKALDVVDVCNGTAQLKTSHGAFGNKVNRTIHFSANIGQTTQGFSVL